MDQMRREVVRTNLTLLRVRNTPASAPKGTARTDTIGTTAQGMTGTRTDPGTKPQLLSQRKSLYAIGVTSQATMLLLARTARSLRKQKFNLLSRKTTHQWLVPSLAPDQAQRCLRPWASQKTLTIL